MIDELTKYSNKIADLEFKIKCLQARLEELKKRKRRTITMAIGIMILIIAIIIGMSILFFYKKKQGKFIRNRRKFTIKDKAAIELIAEVGELLKELEK